MTEQLKRAGLSALQAGDAARAKELLTQARVGSTDANVSLALAFACVNLKQPDEALEAVDHALELEPRNLRALLFKADHLDRTGQPRVALGFYRGALQVAEQLDQIPNDVAQGLRRAAEFQSKAGNRYRDYLMDTLKSQGYKEESSERFHESLKIAFGDKPAYLQQPRRYFFPGLSQRAFFPREQFPWLESLEASTEAIKKELLQVVDSGDSFGPYLEADGTGPILNEASNLGSMDWSACYLWRDGSVVEEIAQRCPETMQALSQVPLCKIPGHMPSALFSRLAPGTTIAPHHGLVNTRLICHLPLIVPENCGALRVGNHQRTWREGEAFVFDDSVEHEAWNNADSARVVLLFDVWRPELSEEEQHWVSLMLQAVGDYDDGAT